MKKIILGLTAALALVSFGARAMADEAPAGDTAKPAKAEKKSKKKHKKGGEEKKAEEPAPAK